MDILLAIIQLKMNLLKLLILLLNLGKIKIDTLSCGNLNFNYYLLKYLLILSKYIIIFNLQFIFIIKIQ